MSPFSYPPHSLARPAPRHNRFTPRIPTRLIMKASCLDLRHLRRLRCLPLVVSTTLAIMIGPPLVAAQEDWRRVALILESRCGKCHSTSLAQADVRVLDRDSLVNHGFLKPRRPNDSPLYQRMIDQDEARRMPPATEPRMSPEEIATIAEWIHAGAPQLPPVDDDAGGENGRRSEPTTRLTESPQRHIHRTIRRHLANLPSADRNFVRFFTSTHLLASGASREELNEQRDALAKTINHLSRERAIVLPIAIDSPHDTVFAVDIRRLGWTRTAVASSDGKIRLNRHDLVLLEYPYASIPNDDGEFQQLMREYIEPARMARPIASVRVDWFVSTATLSPLYEDMLALPATLKELERELGVDSELNEKQAIARRGGLAVSAVSTTIRLLEWHPSFFGEYWKSYDFMGSAGPGSFFRDPIQVRADGGEMIFTLPNGMPGYFVADGQGVSIHEAPTSIVADRFAADAVVRNALSCIRCHSEGPKRFSDVVRDSLLSPRAESTFDMRHALDLYATREEMNEKLDAGRGRFEAAMRAIQRQSTAAEPVTPVSRGFLDAPLDLEKAKAELGVEESEAAANLLSRASLANLGLASLASGQQARRDLWEASFPLLIAQGRVGEFVPPLDGLIHTRVGKGTGELILRTNRVNNVFAPGDELFFTVRNETTSDRFVELWGTDVAGRIAPLIATPTRVAAGAELRIPNQGSFRVQDLKGKEQVAMFASTEVFPPGTLLTGNNTKDRVFHDLFASLTSNVARQIARNVEKQVLIIETR